MPYTNSNLLNNTSDAASSPFVIAIQDAGIAALPSIVNAVILISACVRSDLLRRLTRRSFSAGNSDLYASSRTLYGLALDHKAPRFFRCPLPALLDRADRSRLHEARPADLVFGRYRADLGPGVPERFERHHDCVQLVSGRSVAALADSFRFVNLSTITGLLTWMTIFIAYIRFHAAVKHQGVDRSAFPYLAPFQPWFSYCTLGLRDVVADSADGLFIITVVVFFNVRLGHARGS